MSSSFTPVSDPLCSFTSATHFEDVPQAVRHEAKRSLLNFFATSLGGCRDAAIGKASTVLRNFAGQESATVIGTGERTDMLNAAFLNAMSANVFDFDDTHERTIIHPTAPVAPALLALSEWGKGLSGPQFLLSLIVGMESECRIGNAISPDHYRRGWHITSTCGVFGAAIAVARALNLDGERTRWAIGNASVQAGGLVETLGTMSKSISVGNAARNGILSALLAHNGFEGPALPLEGERGFLRVAVDEPNPTEITHELGSRWEVLANTYKPYPCGVVLNPVIEACLALAADPELALADVEQIELVGHPLLRERTDRPDIKTGRQAQVSAQHSVAVALSTGRAGLSEFSDERVADPALRRLGSKVIFVDDTSFSVDGARITMRMRGGRLISHTVKHARGSATNPLSDAALEQKLKALAEYGNVQFDVQRLIDAVWSLEQVPCVSSLLAIAIDKRK